MIRMLNKTEINFINKRFVAAVFSIALIGVGIAAMFGLQDKILHHDLRGGSTVRVVFKDAPGGEGQDGRQAVYDALTETPIEFNEEEVEFTVSSVSRRLTDEFKDRIYKIDSNLPSYDGEGEPPYEELADVISRIFEGKLELLNVEVGTPTIANSGAEPDASSTGFNLAEPPKHDGSNESDSTKRYPDTSR